MTRQPAVQLGVPLPVAANAKSHFKIYRTQSIHILHFTMTLRTVQPGPFDMRNVIEINEVRHPIDPQPGDGFLLIIVLLFLENLGMVRNDVLMAEKAFLHGRQSRMGGAFHVRVAESTVDLLHPGMNPMAEINRLLRADPLARENVIQIEHGREKQGDPSNPEIATLRFEPLFFHQFPLPSALRPWRKAIPRAGLKAMVSPFPRAAAWLFGKGGPTEAKEELSGEKGLRSDPQAPRTRQ